MRKKRYKRVSSTVGSIISKMTLVLGAASLQLIIQFVLLVVLIVLNEKKGLMNVDFDEKNDTLNIHFTLQPKNLSSSRVHDSVKERVSKFARPDQYLSFISGDSSIYVQARTFDKNIWPNLQSNCSITLVKHENVQELEHLPPFPFHLNIPPTDSGNRSR